MYRIWRPANGVRAEAEHGTGRFRFRHRHPQEDDGGKMMTVIVAFLGGIARGNLFILFVIVIMDRVFEHSDILECNPQSKSKIGRSFGLHSGVFTPIRSAIQISIQNRPEFWIAPLHGVPLQMPCEFHVNKSSSLTLTLYLRLGILPAGSRRSARASC